MIHCYEKEQNTEEQTHIVPDALVSPRINEGHLRGGAKEDYFCFYGWDKPCITNISFPASRNVLSGGILPWIFSGRNLKISLREKSNLFSKLNLYNLTLYILNFHFEQRNHEIIKEIYLVNKLKIGISREIFWFSEKINYILHPWKENNSPITSH